MAATFDNQVRAWANKSKARMSRLKKQVAISLFTDVVMDTPVGNPDHWNLTKAQKKAIKASGYVGGQLRGSWRPTFAAPSNDKTPRTDASGGVVSAEIAAVVNQAPDSDAVDLILTNRMPYAARVEYDGWSGKSPEGMVRRNALRVRKLVQQRLAKEKNGLL